MRQILARAAVIFLLSILSGSALAQQRQPQFYHLNATAQDLDIIMQALEKEPWATVNNLMVGIYNQRKAQIDEFNKPPPPSPTHQPQKTAK